MKYIWNDFRYAFDRTMLEYVVVADDVLENIRFRLIKISFSLEQNLY